jgi:hypothetical protein
VGGVESERKVKLNGLHLRSQKALPCISIIPREDFSTSVIDDHRGTTVRERGARQYVYLIIPGSMEIRTGLRKR